MATALLSGIALLAIVLGFTAGGLWNTDHKTGAFHHLRRIIGLLVISLGFFVLIDAPGAGSYLPDSSDSSSENLANTEWGEDYDEGLKLAAEEGRPIVIDAWATWCASCKSLWKETFQNKRVQEKLEGYVRIKLDMDLDKNQPYWEQYNIKGLPWIGFMTPQGTVLKQYILTDYESPDDFLKRVAAVDKVLHGDGAESVEWSESFAEGTKRAIESELSGVIAYVEPDACADCGPAVAALDDPTVKGLFFLYAGVKLKASDEAAKGLELNAEQPHVAFLTRRGVHHHERLVLSGPTITADAFLAMANQVPQPTMVGEWIAEYGWFVALIFVFLAGIAASFTPCVYPIIPITLGVIGARVASSEGGKGYAFRLSLAFTGVLVMTYTGLGVIVAMTSAKFGALTMQNPWIVGAVVSIFVLMAFSMIGLFSLQLPPSLQQKLQGRQRRMAEGEDEGDGHPYLLAGFSGFVAALVAAPCVGPVLIALITFAQQLGDPLAAFGIMLVFSLGFGLIFLVLGTFSGLLSKIPKSGPWMERVKIMFAVAFVLVGFIILAAVRPELQSLSQDIVIFCLG